MILEILLGFPLALKGKIPIPAIAKKPVDCSGKLPLDTSAKTFSCYCETCHRKYW